MKKKPHTLLPHFDGIYFQNDRLFFRLVFFFAAEQMQNFGYTLPIYARCLEHIFIHLKCERLQHIRIV